MWTLCFDVQQIRATFHKARLEHGLADHAVQNGAFAHPLGADEHQVGGLLPGCQHLASALISSPTVSASSSTST